jgi:hypothetical protein
MRIRYKSCKAFVHCVVLIRIQKLKCLRFVTGPYPQNALQRAMLFRILCRLWPSVMFVKARIIYRYILKKYQFLNGNK